jgi:hypothetical protein
MLSRLRCVSASHRRAVLRPPPLMQTRTTDRRPHPIAAVPSPDGGLLALARSDAVVELHELPPTPATCSGPAGGVFGVSGASGTFAHADDSVPGEREGQTINSPSTLRLALQPADSAARAADLVWAHDHDTLFVALQDRPAVWAFDLETCATDRPTRVYDVRRHHSTPGMVNLAIMPASGLVAAAAVGAGVYLFDHRETRRVVAELEVPSRNNALAAADHVLYVCGEGMIQAHDARKLPVPVPRCHSSLSIGTRPLTLTSAKPNADCSSTLGVLRVDSGRALHFNLAKTVRGGTGLVYQLSNGTVGLADMTTGVVAEEHIEPSKPTEVPVSGLYVVGSRETSLNELPWHVARQRGCLLRGISNRGWLALVPCARSRGFRVIPVGLSPLSGKRAEIPVDLARIPHTDGFATLEVKTPGFVSCLTAAADLRRVLVGYASNGIAVYENVT